MVNVHKVSGHVSFPHESKGADSPVPNHLLILMLLQSKTAELASENQVNASKRKRAAAFTQSIISELKRKGNFSYETAGSHKAFIEQLNEKFGKEKLGYNEELVLKQLNQTFEKLDSFKSEMEKLQKEINSLRGEVSKLEKDKAHFQKKLSEYTSKFKDGGFAVPGYNAFLAAKILEYKKKRDNTQDEITRKSGELNLKKIPELNALMASAEKIKKGFEGSKETDAIKMMTIAEDEMAQAKALLDAAMSSSNFLS